MAQRQGKKFRSGKAIRSWLLSILPNSEALDLALLLTFWSKGMALTEDISDPLKPYYTLLHSTILYYTTIL
eukprot:2349826-Heterocapsa_arctica.AAC.1